MLSQLYSHSAIEARVTEIASQVNKDFTNIPVLHVIVTLNGSFMFAADLVRKLNMPIEMHFAGESSYHGKERGTLEINEDSLPPSFGNNPVLLIEDLMNSGNTVTALRELIAARSASQVKVAALLKRQGGKTGVDYYGFTIPKGLFVVGYGLDLNGRYREKPDLHSYGEAMMQGDSGLC